VLNFQLIAAENTNTRDPAVASLDTLLRSVLKFSGYRLLSTSVAAASEGQMVSQTISADGDPLLLSVQISELRSEGNDASVQLYVQLNRQSIPATPQNGGTGGRRVSCSRRACACRSVRPSFSEPRRPKAERAR
jgi:hypothetical protein